MASFAGETPIDATLDNGPTRDFNVMVRRGRATATVQAHRSTPSLFSPMTFAVTLIFCVQGQLDVTLDGATRIILQPDDTLRLDASDARHCDVTCAQPDTSWLQIGIATTDHSR